APWVKRFALLAWGFCSRLRPSHSVPSCQVGSHGLIEVRVAHAHFVLKQAFDLRSVCHQLQKPLDFGAVVHVAKILEGGERLRVGQWNGGRGETGKGFFERRESRQFRIIPGERRAERGRSRAFFQLGQPLVEPHWAAPKRYLADKGM